jgi:hypothetical protein
LNDAFHIPLDFDVGHVTISGVSRVGTL